jgi:hypothetical protein
MSLSRTQQQAPVSDEAIRYTLDKLLQDLTTKLLPILRSGSRFHIEGDHSGEPGQPVKLKITEVVN